ncbi:type II toxin-antitoxin system death-on-curing family toxin [Woodsholea maritima]|uniref:type II toxin-antitoxin system death-on-curing family toxin n=1 Tax=Woodsholea maritima TaxID=240237 RepID=UPI00036FAF5F|nr:type II toxin-antitoxin system death-on-curing family toxin [Woodsholea maritima]
MKEVVFAIHDEQIAEHEGAEGLRDLCGLETALMRPVNAFHYGESDLCVLAGLYAEGICRNPPFVDGNKRTAFLTSVVFLAINGLRLTASEADTVIIVVKLAAGEIDAAGYAYWLRTNHEVKTLG